ncbi:TolB family protein [Pseudoduganella sp. HUAS MS19]
MKRLYPLAVVVSAATMSLSAPCHCAAAVPICRNIATEAKMVALTSMDIRTPVYFTRREGQLFKADLASLSSKRLADQEFVSGVNMTQSADGRWISYLGTRASGTKTQYWLFDRQTDSGRLVYEHAVREARGPSFSPDSNYLVIGVTTSSRWSGSESGIFLFDVATLKRTKLKLPVSIPEKELGTSTSWSEDGTELLILARSMLHDGYKVPFEYVSYRPASKSFEKLAGRFESYRGHHAFIRNGREIPIFESLEPRSTRVPKAEGSPGGTWHAFVENKAGSEQHLLKIRNRDGRIRTVGSTENASCGRNIISGWLDEDHLVIRQGFDEFLVYEASSGNMAELPEELKRSGNFTW